MQLTEAQVRLLYASAMTMAEVYKNNNKHEQAREVWDAGQALLVSWNDQHGSALGLL